MALEGHAGVSGRHSASVVGHLYESTPGVAHHDVNLRGAGVGGILHQFLDDRAWALDHFARSYLVGN